MRYFACLLVSCTANTADLYRVLLCIEFVHQKLCDFHPVPRVTDLSQIIFTNYRKKRTNYLPPPLRHILSTKLGGGGVVSPAFLKIDIFGLKSGKIRLK